MAFIEFQLIENMVYQLLGNSLLVTAFLCGVIVLVLVSKQMAHPAIILPILGILLITLIVNPRNTNWIDLPAWIAFPVIMLFAVFAFFALWSLFTNEN